MPNKCSLLLFLPYFWVMSLLFAQFFQNPIWLWNKNSPVCKCSTSVDWSIFLQFSPFILSAPMSFLSIITFCFQLTPKVPLLHKYVFTFSSFIVPDNYVIVLSNHNEWLIWHLNIIFDINKASYTPNCLVMLLQCRLHYNTNIF